MPPLRILKRKKKKKKKVEEEETSQSQSLLENLSRAAVTQPPRDSNCRPPSPPAIYSEAQASQSLPQTHPGREEESPQAWVEVHTPGQLEDQQSESTSTEPELTQTSQVSTGLVDQLSESTSTVPQLVAVG